MSRDILNLVKTLYHNLDEITKLQKKIMLFIDYWVHVEKTPIPQRSIVEEMIRRKQNPRTVTRALNSLRKLRYIRKAETMLGDGEGNRTSYVQLRRV